MVASSREPEKSSGREETCVSVEKLTMSWELSPGPAGKLRWAQAVWDKSQIAHAVSFLLEGHFSSSLIAA